MTLELRPITIRDAQAFVDQYHRHHAASRGGRFALAAWKADQLVGVVMAGRPVARMLDDGHTIELTRCCTDGTRNACSFLYGAAIRTAKAMGYRRIVTYTREDESGASLKASGFTLDGTLPGLSWSRATRTRDDAKQHLEAKQRWVACTPLGGGTPKRPESPVGSRSARARLLVGVAPKVA